MNSPKNYEYEIEALELCKQYLWDGYPSVLGGLGKRAFTCDALTVVAKDNRKLVFAVSRVKIWIKAQLDGHYIAGDWLIAVHKITKEEYLDTVKMQAWRLAWVDHMIGILKS